MISMYYHAILEKHPDLLLSIVHALLQMRYDLDKSQIAEAMDGCNNIWEQYQQKHPTDTNSPPPISGIFTKLKLANRVPSYTYKKKK